MVELVGAGRDPADLASAFEPSARAVGHWGAQPDQPDGRREARASAADAGLRVAQGEGLPGGGERTSRGASSATFALERGSGSPARAGCCGADLRVDEHKPGLLPDRRDRSLLARIKTVLLSSRQT